MSRKFSEAPGMLVNSISPTDAIVVLDRSATSGEGSGPGGTIKLLEAREAVSFTTVKSVVHILPLFGIDTDQSLYKYVSDAINVYGPFNGQPGALFLFKVNILKNTIGPAAVALRTMYFKILSGALVVGGPATVSEYDIALDGGPFDYNTADQPDLFIDIGDLNDNPVQDVFNNGPGFGQPWQILEGDDRLIKGVIDGVVNVWTFSGGVGNWGGDETDPNYLEATAVMFSNLNEQPGIISDPVAWGDISGDINNQNDLINLLNNSQNNDVLIEPGITLLGNYNIDWEIGDVWILEFIDNLVLSDINLRPFPKTITIYVKGPGVFSYTDENWNLDLSDYDVNKWNRITIDYVKPGFYSSDLKVLN